jgi:hypothetical protein
MICRRAASRYGRPMRFAVRIFWWWILMRRVKKSMTRKMR